MVHRLSARSLTKTRPALRSKQAEGSAERTTGPRGDERRQHETTHPQERPPKVFAPLALTEHYYTTRGAHALFLTPLSVENRVRKSHGKRTGHAAQREAEEAEGAEA